MLAKACNVSFTMRDISGSIVNKPIETIAIEIYNKRYRFSRFYEAIKSKQHVILD